MQRIVVMGAGPGLRSELMTALMRVELGKVIVTTVGVPDVVFEPPKHVMHIQCREVDAITCEQTRLHDTNADPWRRQGKRRGQRPR